MVEHRLVEWHRDRLGRLEADGGVALLLVLDARQLDHADDDLLVGHAEPDALRQAGLGDEVLEGFSQAVAVHDLAVGDKARGQLGARAADDATTLYLGGGEVATVDIQTDGAT